MRILLVEDDEDKRKQVRDVILEVEPLCEIVEARSLQGGRRALGLGTWSLVVLDMSMPTFDISAEEPGGRTQALGGRELLRDMARRNLVAPVVVVTQFDRFGQGRDEMTLAELNAELMEAYSDYYVESIYYNPADDEWKDRLVNLISTLRVEEG